MKKKLFITGAVVIALIGIIVTGILILNTGKKQARSATVLEMSGTCTVERSGKVLDAAEGMQLFSEDILIVGQGSSTRIRIDDDKFIYLDENSRLRLSVTGTADESKTTAFLERGSMLTEVKHKLSADSSYVVVTPNTSMYIRGTKTLTEVYEDILGAIKTNAAVVEGQVDFKTIQKDSTGKAVTVSCSLSLGTGLGVTTDSKDLLDLDDIKHITEDGTLIDGQEVESTTYEELGTKLETPVFGEDFLTNVVAVLARSREEDVTEGFAAEDITEEELNYAINVLNDVIDGKVDLPPSVENYIISLSRNYYEENIASDSSASETNDPKTDGTDTGDTEDAAGGNDTVTTGGNDDTAATGQDDDTVAPGGDDDTVATGGDDDTVATGGNDDTVATGGNDDTVATGGDDTGATGGNGSDSTSEDTKTDGTDIDDNKSLQEETEEERIAREEKERLEKEEPERLEKEEKEKLEKEEKERLAKEEQERKEKEEKERLAKEEREKAEREAAERAAREAEEREAAERAAREAAEREAAERAAREAAEREAAEKAAREAAEREAAERAAREAAEREAAEKAAREAAERETAEKAAQENNGDNPAGSGSGEGTGDSGPEYKVTFKEPSNRTYTLPEEFNAIASGNIELKLVFKESGDTSSDIKYTASTLSGIAAGELLPGYYGSAYDPYIVSDVLVGEDGEYMYSLLSSYVAFTGWYTSEESAKNGVESDRIMTMPSSGTVELWPGMAEIYIVAVVNRFEKAADFVIPTNPSGNVVGYETLSDESDSKHLDVIYLKVKKGTSVALPVVSGTDIQTDSAYLRKDTAAGQSTEFFCYTVAAMDNNEFFNPSVVYLAGSKPATYGEGISVYYTVDGSENIVVDKPLFISAYFVSDVEVRVLDNTSGTILVNEYGFDEAAEPVGDYYNSVRTSGEAFAVLPNDYPEINDSRTAWKVTKTKWEEVDLYTFTTGYFGLEMQMPKFSCQKAEKPDGWTFDPGNYQKELLCNYRLGDEVTYSYDSIFPVVFGTAKTDQTAFPFDGSAIEGKYVFTIQAVDWVYVNSVPSGSVATGAAICFVVESNNPYVIHTPNETSDNIYKFAVDPVDLFEEPAQLPSACFIYAPADIEPGSADPNDIYRNDIQSISNRSYAFVGVQGYRLKGFSFNLSLCSTDNVRQLLLRISDAVPVLIEGTERNAAYILSFGDIVSLDGTYYDWDYLLREPLELVPVFEHDQLMTEVYMEREVFGRK